MITLERKIGPFRIKEVFFAEPRDVKGCAAVHFLSFKKVFKSGFERREDHTVWIDLTKPENELWLALSPTTRNEISRTLRLGVTIKKGVAWDQFYQMHLAVQRSKHFSASDKTLLKKGTVLFTAWMDDRLLAGALFYDDKPLLRAKIIANCRHIDRSRESGKLASYATRRAIWEAARFGKENGYTILDLGGACLDPQDPRYSVTQFKLTFGGKVTPEYHYEKIYNPLFRIARGLYTSYREIIR